MLINEGPYCTTNMDVGIPPEQLNFSVQGFMLKKVIFGGWNVLFCFLKISGEGKCSWGTPLLAESQNYLNLSRFHYDQIFL